MTQPSNELHAVPVCQHLHVCSGCPAMGLSYQQQLSFKHKRVADPVARFPILESVEVEPVIGSELQLEYRTRAKLMVESGAEVGLFAKQGDHRVVDLPGCRVLSPLLASVAAWVRTELAAGTLGLTPGRELVAIDVREAAGQGVSKALLTLVIRKDHRPADGVLQRVGERLLQEQPDVRGVAVNLRDARSIQVLGPETFLIAGEGVLPDRQGDAYHHATFGAFTQINRRQAARVHAMVADAMKAAVAGVAQPRVLELYGGAGAMGLGLARMGARVDMVESFAPAAYRATEAAKEQGLDGRFRAIVGDAAKATRELVEAGRHYDFALANPPRRGMSPPVRSWLARTGVRAIGYVSCDPDTLARDLADLALRGYRSARIRPLDMIPQTHEVESFVRLERGELPPPVILADHPDLVAVDKGGHEAVGPLRIDEPSLALRVRRAFPGTLPISLGRLDPDASGVAVFVKTSQAANDLAQAADDPDTSETYVVLCVGRVPARGKRAGRWRRLAVVGGHSLVRVERAGLGGVPLTRSLAAVGLRVVGDRRTGHAATNAYFEERHTLDRAFAHRMAVSVSHRTLGQVWRAHAPLAGDLVTVLVRLGGEVVLEHPEVAPLLAPGGPSST